MEAREARDSAKSEYDRLSNECNEIELDVYEMFEGTDDDGDPHIQGTLKVPLGEPWGTVAFRARETYFARIIDEDDLQKHYEERAMIDEVSAPRFVKKRLNTEVRDCLDHGIPLPPGLDFYAQRGMTITRQKD